MTYISTKTYNQIGPVAYRQWRADSHCNLIHGYALSFHFEFTAEALDARNWVVDFGGLKPLKALLEDWFDHTLLVAEDDPMKEHLLNLGTLGLAKITMVEKTGCEGIADFLYTYVNDCFLKDYGQGDRVWCTKVEVRETSSNMAMRVGQRPKTFREGITGTVIEPHIQNMQEPGLPSLAIRYSDTDEGLKLSSKVKGV